MMYLAKGKSMKNFIGFGLLKEKTLDEIPSIIPVKIGDIIRFKGHDGKYYCHRVVKLENDLVTTKGDLFSESKAYEINVPVKNILGIIVWRWPNE